MVGYGCKIMRTVYRKVHTVDKVHEEDRGSIVHFVTTTTSTKVLKHAYRVKLFSGRPSSGSIWFLKIEFERPLTNEYEEHTISVPFQLILKADIIWWTVKLKTRASLFSVITQPSIFGNT